MAQNPVQFSDSYNFGPNPQDELTVKEMAEMALKIWESGNIEFPVLNGQPHEAGLLSLDISKAAEKLQWQPKWTAEQALEYTLQWYKTYYCNENIDKLMVEQINSYFANKTL